jgi:predicted RNA-binding protein with TRAM domain
MLVVPFSAEEEKTIPALMVGANPLCRDPWFVPQDAGNRRLPVQIRRIKKSDLPPLWGLVGRVGGMVYTPFHPSRATEFALVASNPTHGGSKSTLPRPLICTTGRRKSATSSANQVVGWAGIYPFPAVSGGGSLESVAPGVVPPLEVEALGRQGSGFRVSAFLIHSPETLNPGEIEIEIEREVEREIARERLIERERD